MQLNLGCGFDHSKGYVNVDSWPGCAPDCVVDLEKFPWPFEDCSITRILAHHVLEHLGGDLATFRGLWREIYRIAAPACEIDVRIPYYKSAEFWTDPTHVRVYTRLTFEMLSKAVNQRWIEEGKSNTKLAMMFDVDFAILANGLAWEADWQDRLDRKQITLQQLIDIERNSWNVVKELSFELAALK